MKKLLSVFLAVLICVLPLAGNMTVMAANVDATYTFGDAEGYAGEEITVDVELVIDAQFNTIGFAGLEYDTDSLTFVKCAINKELSDMCAITKFDKNQMTLVAAVKKENDDGDPIPAPTEFDGLVCTLTFKINEDAPVGSTDITIGNPQVKMDSALIATGVESGTITVLGKDFEGLEFKNKTVTYDSNVHTLEVEGVPAFADVKYTVDGEEFTGAEDVGTYNVTATVTADGYNDTPLHATLTINKKTITVNATVANKIYDGTDAVLGFDGTPSIEGYIAGDDLGISEESLATVKFASKDVGTHEILHEIKVIGDDKDNYEYTINVPKASITKRSATIKAEDKTIKVGEALPALTAVVEGVVEGETLDYTLSTTAKNSNTVKNYPITVKADAKKNPNYDITVTNGTLYVIDKTVQDVNVSPVDDVTYGDEGFKLDVTVGEVANDSEVTYASATPAVVAVDENGNVTILGAGTAKITVSKAGDADYADFEETVTFTVNKKNVTVTAVDVTVTKGDAIPALTEYEVEGLVNGDELTVTLTTTAKNSNTVKDYPITVKVAANANYNITTVNGTLSVIDKLKQDITVTSNAPSSITYGDEGFKIDVTYGDTVTDAETVIASDNENVAKVDENGNVTIVGAGEATITVSKAGNDTIADFAEEIKVEVAKKPITITAKDASKKVGADDPVLEYEVTGTLVGDDSFSGNVEREEGEEVGEYDIFVGTVSLTNYQNYDVNFVPGTFTIFDKTPQDVGVTQSYSKTYGDDSFKLDVTLGEEVTDSAVTYTAETENVSVDEDGNVTILGAGTAKITVSKAGNEDYADVSKTVTINIAKKAIKVTADAKEKYVDEETPALTYTTDVELVGDDAFTGELTVSDGNKAGRSYDIKQGTLALNDNYKITYVGAKLTVLSKVEQEIEIGDVDGLTYGGQGTKLEVTYGDYNADAEVVFTSDDENVVTVDAEGNITIVGAGEAEISVTVAGNYKYNDFEDSVTLTVAKKAVKVTADDKTKRIGTADPELTYTPDVELVEGDAFTGELTREAGEDLGTYDILQGTLALSDNYKLTFVKGTFTIVDKNPQTVTVDGIPETAAYGDTSFTITASSAEVEDAAVTYSSDNEDVISVDENGVATVGNAGEATITVTVAGNDDYAEAVVTKTVVVAAKEIAVTALDLVNKTATFDGVLEADADAVSVDFSKLTFVPEEVEEEQTPANYVVTGLELAGDKSGNYVLTTESVLVPISDEIALVTVSAIAENGTVEGIGSYLAGATVTVKATPNTNYKFSGWYVGEEKVSSDAEYTFTADADIELVAKFAKKSAGGGSGSATPTRTVYFRVAEDDINSVTVNKGSKVARPEDPTLEGYNFEGWFVDAEFTAEFDFDSEINDSITVYAKWTAVDEEPDEGKDEPDEDEGKTDEPAEWENPYTDVDENDWFFETVKEASAGGIMNGMSETTFVPYAELTRAMLVTILYRADGEAAVEGDVTFEDVNLDAYYGDAIIWATENGIVNGYDEKTFAPDAKITREQIAAIMFRYAIYKGVEAVDLSENLGFKDADGISEYAVSSMNWAVGQGIITGYENNTIKPKSNATRAEAATIVVRFLAKLG